MFDLVHNVSNGTVLYIAKMPNRFNRECGWHFRSDQNKWLGPYPTENEAVVAAEMQLEPDC